MKKVFKGLTAMVWIGLYGLMYIGLAAVAVKWGVSSGAAVWLLVISAVVSIVYMVARAVFTLIDSVKSGKGEELIDYYIAKVKEKEREVDDG